MGDRANVVVKNSNTIGVWIYTHWGGYELAGRVQKALAKKWRWDDESYLTRIIYDEVVRGSEREETGLGISTYMGDNEHKIVVVCVNEQRVKFVIEGNDVYIDKGVHSWTFEEFINLSADDLEKTYNRD